MFNLLTRHLQEPSFPYSPPWSLFPALFPRANVSDLLLVFLVHDMDNGIPSSSV